MTDGEERRLSAIFSAGVSLFEPPERLTVDEWADKYRVLDASASAESGRWRTARTPYLIEPMRAFTQNDVQEITVVSPSQIGKSEFEMNVVGYIIDQQPGGTLYLHPDKKDAEEFSKMRLAAMLKSVPRVAEKLRLMESGRATGRKAASSILMKPFPGGFLNLAGTNDANAISSKPIRYVIGDELDRWATSAGRDGDPWELAMKRQETFFNRKRLAVSTPTIKGASRIEALYERGTQERWRTQCPHCGAWEEIRFDDIRFSAREVRDGKRVSFDVTVHGWRCPACGGMVDEYTAKRQPSKWVATAPDNLQRNGARSFWLNGFVSPWCSWRNICAHFCEVKNDPEKLKAFRNTTLGELWELRSMHATEDELMSRAEEYPADADLPGSPGREDAPLLLTCGVDCQHTYLQFEVVGWGRYGESWGIQAGYIPGSPADDATWAQLDAVISRVYRWPCGKGLRVALTFIDSGDGNFTNEIARRCAARQRAAVFAVKGDGTSGRAYITPPRKHPFDGNERHTYWLYTLGVNAGKAMIMDAVAVEQPGANFMHFPRGDGRGYDLKWYMGLLSETEVRKGNKVVWEKVHTRNEPLDCRNYAQAAAKVLNPDFDALARQLLGDVKPREKKPAAASKPPKRRRGGLRDLL